LTSRAAPDIIATMNGNDHGPGPAPNERWREALAAFVGGVRAALGDKVVRCVLFGSRARGDHGADSDLDLLVFVREEKDIPAAEDAVAGVKSRLTAVHADALFIMTFVYTEASFRRDASYFFIKNVKAEGVEV